MRIKIIKDHEEHKSGEVKDVTPNIAHGLINKGIAMLSKDMQQQEYKTKVMTTRKVNTKRGKRGKSA